MGKSFLQLEQGVMSDTAHGNDRPEDPVEAASRWAAKLVERAYRGLGDSVDEAMKRVARDARVPRSVLWALRYRPPKDLGARAYVALRATYRNELLRQGAKLELDIEIARRLPQTDARRDLIAESEALLGSVRSELQGLGQ